MVRPEEKTILVVDDEEDVRDYFSTVLEDAGFNVMTAADGNEALQKVNEKRPDYISLDLVMPNKSGLKFLRELRKNRDWTTIPFVIVTAHASDDLGKPDLKNILADKTFSGPGIYLEKPIVPERYLDFFCKELGVSLEGKPKESGVSPLQSEIDRLTKGADPDTLDEIIKMLQQRK